jgi:hypothetical protein
MAFRNHTPVAAVGVPKAAMHENKRFVPPQYNIRLSRQSSGMESKPKAHAVQKSADFKFGLSIATAD